VVVAGGGLSKQQGKALKKRAQWFFRRLGHPRLNPARKKKKGENCPNGTLSEGHFSERGRISGKNNLPTGKYRTVGVGDRRNCRGGK